MQKYQSLRSISIDEITRQLGRVDYFSGLNANIHREVAEQIEVIQLEPHDILVRQGEDADSIFVLLEGRLGVVLTDETEQERVIADLQEGSIVGEIALIAGGQRSATVVATEASTLGVLKATVLARLMNLYPEVASSIVSMASKRLRKSQLAFHLVRLFEGLDAKVIHELQSSVEWLSLAAGEILFRHGEPADACYIVVSGRLRKTTDKYPEIHSSRLDVVPGQMTGDFSMIMEETHRWTMTAVRDSEIARIPRSVFEGWIEHHPHTMLEWTQKAFRRYRTPSIASEQRPRLMRSIAVVSVGKDLDLTPMLQQLETNMSEYGETITLSSERVDALLHKPGISQSAPGTPANIRLLHWLSEIEKARQYVVYVADCTHCEWSNRAIRQADHIVFVAEASGDSSLQDIERNHRHLLHQDPQRSSLLLLHDADSARPMQTARWLHARSVDAVYHLRRGNNNDLARLTRILIGRATGLVLGGGGARGFAHLGVLRALEELGVPIDMIGGTSIGAPIAMAAAQGMNAEECQEAVSRSFRSLLDYTLPIASLLAGRRITNNIGSYAGSWDIEDLWLPFFCVSTNITTARSCVHRRGDVSRAVRASVSIPGVLPPVPIDGDLHVDGGTLNNLPIDIMRKLNPTGKIIAADVLPPMGPRAKSDYPLGLSGMKILLSRALPWRKPIRVPSIGSTILASMTIGSAGSLRRMIDDQLADLYLSINVKGVSMLKFEEVEHIADIGYQQSFEQLSKWAVAAKAAMA